MALSANQTPLAGPLAEPHDLYWLIGIRGIVLGLLVIAGIITRLAGTITEAGLVGSLPLFGIMCLYNLASWGILRAAGTRPDRAQWRTWIRWLQQPGDVLGITYVLHLINTGGITPLAVLYCIAILAAILILPPW